ncbi:MAG: hypothetical protein ACRD0K_24765 [Egibacteraceae bacterium]
MEFKAAVKYNTSGGSSAAPSRPRSVRLIGIRVRRDEPALATLRMVIFTSKDAIASKASL